MEIEHSSPPKAGSRPSHATREGVFTPTMIGSSAPWPRIRHLSRLAEARDRQARAGDE